MEKRATGCTVTDVGARLERHIHKYFDHQQKSEQIAPWCREKAWRGILDVNRGRGQSKRHFVGVRKMNEAAAINPGRWPKVASANAGATQLPPTNHHAFRGDQGAFIALRPLSLLPELALNPCNL